MAKAGVNVIDMFSDYFFGTDKVDQKLKALSETTKQTTTATEQ